MTRFGTVPLSLAIILGVQPANSADSPVEPPQKGRYVAATPLGIAGTIKELYRDRKGREVRRWIDGFDDAELAREAFLYAPPRNAAKHDQEIVARIICQRRHPRTAPIPSWLSSVFTPVFADQSTPLPHFESHYYDLDTPSLKNAAALQYRVDDGDAVDAGLVHRGVIDSDMKRKLTMAMRDGRLLRIRTYDDSGNALHTSVIETDHFADVHDWVLEAGCGLLRYSNLPDNRR